MSVESPVPSEFSPQKHSLLDWFKGKLSGAPKVVVLPVSEVQTEGNVLVKEGISIFAGSNEFIAARNTARRQARDFDNDPERSVNIEAADIPIGRERFSVRVIETQETQGRVPLAVRMVIRGLEPSVPFFRINIDLRSSDSQRPEIAYEDNRPGGQSQNPNTAAAVASIKATFTDLKTKLPAPLQS